MAKKSVSTITNIIVRMFRAGTGDFFVLKFMADKEESFTMMIDCGCIGGGKDTFEPLVMELQSYITNNTIDLLVVTHEHADHINGFEKAKHLFKDIKFKKVWFAWTEDVTDDLANDLRKNHSEIKVALKQVALRLNSLKENNYYKELFVDETISLDKIAAQEHFIGSMSELNDLNFHFNLNAARLATMEDYLIDCDVIDDETEVEFLSPGDLKKNLKGASGIRFFVLGPPRDASVLALKERKGEGYEKRKYKSETDFSLVKALVQDIENITDSMPFDNTYLSEQDTETKRSYQDPKNKWREIEYDWLYNAGSLALRFERSINNTSLVLAIQFEDSEKVLLFPGDAEYGNWESWHDGIEWKIKKGTKFQKINAEYLLNHTVLYKVGHHMSQNGSAKENGIEMMIHEELAAMATLDFKKINTRWLNTMPNDILGAELIKRTSGKLFFIGDCEQMLDNIETERVKIKKQDRIETLKNNQRFDELTYIDYEVKG